jgi:uncharacterized protein YigE (DUF2233 family)
MRKMRIIAYLLAAAISFAPHSNGALAETRPCHSIEYEGNAYTICEVDPRKHTIRLYWKRSDGTPYAYLSALPRVSEGEAGRLLFATNAGMFDPALKPVGLYVEQGRELVHVNTASGYGNFHMKPNGVFYISADRAAVAETRAFLKQRHQAQLATQSGPMLVIDGRLHPRFDQRSTSLKARNGVGVRADGKVIFAVSQGEVSFDAFARLFRHGLNCPNALFLDGGSAASLYAPWCDARKAVLEVERLWLLSKHRVQVMIHDNARSIFLNCIVNTAKPVGPASAPSHMTVASRIQPPVIPKILFFEVGAGDMAKYSLRQTFRRGCGEITLKYLEK